MKKKLALFLSAIVFTMSACGSSPVSGTEDPQEVKFVSDINEFCDDILEFDKEINEIDPTMPTSSEALMEELDMMNMRFQNFSKIDFPEKYDYLEEYTLKSSNYMQDANTLFHQAYLIPNKFDEFAEEQARSNYKKAFEVLQIILAVLRGEVELVS